MCIHVKAAEMMTLKLCNILDTMAPVRTVQCRNQFAPWLTPATKELMKQRDEAQKVAASSGENDDWRNFKNKRNTVTACAKKRSFWKVKDFAILKTLHRLYGKI